MGDVGGKITPSRLSFRGCPATRACPATRRSAAETRRRWRRTPPFGRPLRTEAARRLARSGLAGGVLLAPRPPWWASPTRWTRCCGAEGNKKHNRRLPAPRTPAYDSPPVETATAHTTGAEATAGGGGAGAAPATGRAAASCFTRKSSNGSSRIAGERSKKCLAGFSVPWGDMAVWGRLVSVDGERYDLSKETVKVGRAADNDIRLDPEFVSNFHFELLRANDGSAVQLTDQSRTNGTYVGPDTSDLAKVGVNNSVRIEHGWLVGIPRRVSKLEKQYLTFEVSPPA
jgi:hypothetical protein